MKILASEFRVCVGVGTKEKQWTSVIGWLVRSKSNSRTVGEAGYMSGEAIEQTTPVDG